MDNKLLLLGLLAFALFMGSGYSDPGDGDTDTSATPTAYCNGQGFVDADGDGICDNYASGICGNSQGGYGCNGGGCGRGYGIGPR